MTIKNGTVVDSGALQMALNVLRRAGKNEVADELEKSAIRIEDMSSDDVTYCQEQVEKILNTKQQEPYSELVNIVTASSVNVFEKHGLIPSPFLPVEIPTFK